MSQNDIYDFASRANAGNEQRLDSMENLPTLCVLYLYPPPFYLHPTSILPLSLLCPTSVLLRQSPGGMRLLSFCSLFGTLALQHFV